MQNHGKTYILSPPRDFTIFPLPLKWPIRVHFRDVRLHITHTASSKPSTPSNQHELTNLPVSTLHFTAHLLIVKVNITSHNTGPHNVVINIRPTYGIFPASRI